VSWFVLCGSCSATYRRKAVMTSSPASVASLPGLAGISLSAVCRRARRNYRFALLALIIIWDISTVVYRKRLQRKKSRQRRLTCYLGIFIIGLWNWLMELSSLFYCRQSSTELLWSRQLQLFCRWIYWRDRRASAA